METTLDIQNERKTGDTANTVPISDCNLPPSIFKVEANNERKLPSAMLTLIDILARQAAREICNTKEGE